MDDAGLPARHAADQLGHSRVSITQDTYYGRSTSNTRAAGEPPRRVRRLAGAVQSDMARPSQPALNWVTKTRLR
jgi:hypothetical protein